MAKVKVIDGAGVSDAIINSDFERTMDEDTKNMLWGVINENTQLKQENYYLKVKMKEIQKLVGNYDIYES